MATFPSYNPIYSPTKASEPKTRIVQFGDGYEQRLLYGLNQNPKEWNMVFDLTDTQANEVETFLNARAADSASFDWSPPDTTETYKWVCPSWSREFYNVARSRITVTFRQVFEP